MAGAERSSAHGPGAAGRGYHGQTPLPLDNVLDGVQPAMPHLTRSSLYRCLMPKGDRPPAGPGRQHQQVCPCSIPGRIHTALTGSIAAFTLPSADWPRRDAPPASPEPGFCDDQIIPPLPDDWPWPSRADEPLDRAVSRWKPVQNSQWYGLGPVYAPPSELADVICRAGRRSSIRHYSLARRGWRVET
jgi:hypothetical protein